MSPRSIPSHLFAKLQAVPPSRDGAMAYYPCQVTLRDGRRLDRVYVQPLHPYLEQWGVRPEDDRAKEALAIEEVVDLGDSPQRLPGVIAPSGISPVSR